MYVVEEGINIDATPEAVWAVLANLPEWQEWQNFISHDGGAAEPGTTLNVTLRPPGGRTVSFSPTVTVAEPGRELSWHNRMMMGQFDIRHHFRITPSAEGGVRFVQHEEFRGVLAWILRIIGELRKAAPGFRHFNEALKSKVETESP